MEACVKCVEYQAEIALLKAKIDHYIKESFENLAELENENTQLKAQLAALHGAIMNLPVTSTALNKNNPIWSSGYTLGHRDARHAAAELCAAASSDMPVKAVPACKFCGAGNYPGGGDERNK